MNHYILGGGNLGLRGRPEGFKTNRTTSPHLMQMGSFGEKTVSDRIDMDSKPRISAASEDEGDPSMNPCKCLGRVFTSLPEFLVCSYERAQHSGQGGDAPSPASDCRHLVPGPPQSPGSVEWA